MLSILKGKEKVWNLGALGTLDKPSEGGSLRCMWDGRRNDEGQINDIRVADFPRPNLNIDFLDGVPSLGNKARSELSPWTVGFRVFAGETDQWLRCIIRYVTF